MKWFKNNWLYLLIISLPFERIPSYDVPFGTHSVTVRLSLIISILIVLALIPRLVHKPFPKLSAPDYWLVGYIVVMVASGIFAISRSRSLVAIVATILTIAVAVIIEHTFRRYSLNKIGRYIIGISVVVCLFGIYQFFGDSFGLSTSLTGLKDIYTKAVFGFPRVQATALEPLFLASFLLLPLTLLSAKILTTAKLNFKLLGIYWFLLVVFALTLSRGGIYGGLIGLVLLVLLLAKSVKWRGVVAIIGLLILSGGCALGLIAATTSLRHSNTHAVTSYVQQSTHLTSDAGSADSDRSINRKLAIQAFKEHPILGVGVGNFGYYAQQHDPRYKNNNSVVVNNEYLEIAAETGVLGLLTIGGFVIALLLGLIRIWSLLPGNQRQWVAIITSALVATAVQYYAVSTLYIVDIWFEIGLALGLVMFATPREQKKNDHGMAVKNTI